MLTGPLALFQSLDPSQPWRVTLQRAKTGTRVWRLFLDAETSPRLVLWEPVA